MENPKSLSYGIRSQIRPKENRKFLGTRLPQWLYNEGLKGGITGPEDSLATGWDRFLMNNLGQMPILLDSVAVESSIRNMQIYMGNQGYFNSDATYSTQTEERKTEVTYSITANDQHKFGEAEFIIADSSLNSIIRAEFDIQQVVQTGQPFSAAQLGQLRSDIVEMLQDKGYYRFTANSIFVEADTLGKSGYVDVLFNVINEQDSLYSKQFTIKDINVQVRSGFADSLGNPITFNNKNYYPSSIVRLKPETLDRLIQFESGDTYSREAHSATIDKLYDLPIIEFANVEFQLDTIPGYLNAFVTARAGSRRGVTFEPEISQLDDRGIGARGKLAYFNKNWFGGGELLELGGSGGFEVIQDNFFGITYYNLEGTLTLPRLVGAKSLNERFSQNVLNPKTTFGLGFSQQNQADLYSIDEYNFNMGWEFQTSPLNNHTIKFLEISNFRSNPSAEFQETLDANQYLQNSFQDRVIFGGGYNYSYTNAPLKEDNESYLIFEGLFDYSGLFNQLFGDDVAPFVRADVDVRYAKPFGQRTALVSRLNFGIAQPLQSGESIPAVKQFTLGGNSSMRAWQQRSLGPGGYDVEADASVINKNNLDIRSDLKIETNLEFRFPLSKLFGFDLNGAVFTDAGNLWALSDQDQRPESQFQGFQSFDEIAVGAGYGLRLDFNYFEVRTDWGYQLRDPALPNDQSQWVDQPFTNRPNLSFGIGYPF